MSNKIFHVDGFMLGPNPSTEGGGFTVTDDKGAVLCHHVIPAKPGGVITNNDMELCAIGYAAAVYCDHGDTIITDSQVAKAWATKAKCKARPDLKHMCEHLKRLLEERAITILQLPREKNLAGIYNERNEHVV